MWNVNMMLGVHIDGMIVTSSDDDCHALVSFLREYLPTNNLGELIYHKDCTIERD